MDLLGTALGARGGSPGDTMGPIPSAMDLLGTPLGARRGPTDIPGLPLDVGLGMSSQPTLLTHSMATQLFKDPSRGPGSIYKNSRSTARNGGD